MLASCLSDLPYRAAAGQYGSISRSRRIKAFVDARRYAPRSREICTTLHRFFDRRRRNSPPLRDNCYCFHSRTGMGTSTVRLRRKAWERFSVLVLAEQ